MGTGELLGKHNYDPALASRILKKMFCKAVLQVSNQEYSNTNYVPLNVLLQAKKRKYWGTTRC